MSCNGRRTTIEFVRMYPALYNLSNPKYMNRSFKNEIWIKIGEEIEKDGKYEIVILHYIDNFFHFFFLPIYFFFF